MYCNRCIHEIIAWFGQQRCSLQIAFGWLSIPLKGNEPSNLSNYPTNPVVILHQLKETPLTCTHPPLHKASWIALWHSCLVSQEQVWLIDGPIGTAAGQPCSAIWVSARVNIVTEPSHLFHSLLVLYHTTGTSPPKHTHTHSRGNTKSIVQVFPFVILSIAYELNDMEDKMRK